VISAEVRAAIENARTVEINKRPHSFDHVRALVLAVMQELPTELTVADVIDELLISENQ
jgi:hypothetical protein